MTDRADQNQKSAGMLFMHILDLKIMSCKLCKNEFSLEGVEDKFGEIMVPTEEVVEMRGGQKRKSERKFFPGYVLVEMEMDEQTWHLVRTIPKVLGFIGGTSDKPAPISR